MRQNLLQREMQADVGAIASEAGAVVKWKDKDYTVMVGAPTITLDLAVMGGGHVEADFVVKWVRTSLPEIKPAFKDTVNLDGVNYYITQVTDRAGSAWLVTYVKR